MDYMEIIKTILMIALGGLAIYFKCNEQLQKKVTEITAKAITLIKEAEEIYSDGTKQGGKRFEWVVNELYKLIPTPFNKIITKTMIAEIVQSTFNEIKGYTEIQLDKLTDTKN